MNIAIVGAGTVGTAVAVRWMRAGHAIVAVTGRDTTAARAARWLPEVAFEEIAEAVRGAQVVAVAVPDRAIEPVATEVADRIEIGTVVAHLSGALGLGVLGPVVEAGGIPLAIHPLQTFADVEGAIDSLEGSAIAVTADDDAGWRVGDDLAADLGGRPFHLADAHRAVYHAAAVFASNYLVTISGAAETLFEVAGVPDPLAAMRPLQEATLANVHRLGPRDALTGPAVRGDAETIERNLTAISAAAPTLVPSYVALCRAALEVAGERIAPADRAGVEEVLARWR
jgi:predicted short-subunit dehydrogenase-like oxidoreductase (DUF2520 family)